MSSGYGDAVPVLDCHCGALVAVVEDPAMYESLGPAAHALCVRCLPLRCDAWPGACEPKRKFDWPCDRRDAHHPHPEDGCPGVGAHPLTAIGGGYKEDEI